MPDLAQAARACAETLHAPPRQQQARNRQDNSGDDRRGNGHSQGEPDDEHEHGLQQGDG